MLRLKEVASQSQTFPKRALEKQNVNRTLLLPRPATGRTLQLFSIDRPPLLAVRRRASVQDCIPVLQMARVCPTTSAQEFAGRPKNHYQPDPLPPACLALQPQRHRLHIRTTLSVELDWGESLHGVGLADD